MADIKYNVVGATKFLLLCVTFFFKCFACSKKLTLVGSHIDHCEPRAGRLYGVSGMHDFFNLCLLCKDCNSAKGKTPAVEFYTSEKLAELKKLQKRAYAFASFTPNGRIKANDKLTYIGDNLAMQDTTSKFAKEYRSSLFYTDDM